MPTEQLAEAAATPFTVYDGSDAHDALLTCWFDALHSSGELALVFTNCAYGEWMRAWRSPTTLLTFVCDEDGAIWFATWLDTLGSGALFSLWVRKDRRGRKALALLYRVYSVTFQHFPVLVSVTKQVPLLAVLTKLGYTYVGSIPHLYGGDTAHVLYLTAGALVGRGPRHGLEA